MFPTSAFNQGPIGYPFPGQQPPGSLYQSQYGGVAGFNSQVVPPFQQAPPPRGQSLPANGRQYQPLTGPYAAAPPPPSSSRRQQHGQYPPPVSSQHYEYRSSHGSKSKKHHKRRSTSPSGAGEQGLYSDHEQQQKDHREQSEGQQGRSRSHSPTFVSRSKQEGVADHDQQQQQQQQSQVVGGTSADATQGGVARSEEGQAAGGSERHRSGSKKKKHHRRDHYDNYNIAPGQGVPLDINSTNPFQQPYAPQQYSQQPTYYGEYQNELPPQLKVHRQPLYTSYNQAYEESIRRGDVIRKQAKRSTRLPPEVKQQLLPHEDDQQNQPPPPPQSQPQQTYQFGPVPGYPQQPLPPAPGPQPYGAVRPPFNPYQPYGPPSVQPNYYGATPFNALQPWSNVGPIGGPAEQEIQRLRTHIHTLEGELHKLQRKLTKATLNHNEGAGGQGGVNQDDGTRSHRRSKRDGAGSPRQTPVIVELNNTPGDAIRESSSKKHRRRTTSNTSSQQGQQLAQQDATSIQRSGDNTIRPEVTSITGVLVGQNQQAVEARERSRSGGNRNPEGDGKPLPTKNPREETAAQLAHAAAAHVNNRQGVVGPLPPQQQQQQQQPQPQPQQQQQQQQTPAAPPPPAPQLGRPQLPNQQQQQFLYQQGVLPPQGQQIRGPAPRVPLAGNIRYPGDPYQQQQQQQQQFINPQQQQQLINPQQQQQFINPQQRNIPNPNYNQSNNNELFDNDDGDDDVVDRLKQEEQNRSAEKILDAFERFYVHCGKPTTAPMKVKYIPEEMNSNYKRSNHHQHLNTNNNNRYRSSSQRSRSQSSSSESKSIYSHSPASSRHSFYDNNAQKLTIGPFI